MKQHIRSIIEDAAQRAYAAGQLASDDFPAVEVEEPKAAAHGDFSTNIAMVMAAGQKMAPRRIAEAIVAQIADPRDDLARVDVAGPGFINFYLKPSAWHPLLREIHREDRRFGASDLGGGRRVQVEFVSSNPTGPLHVGHGRGAAVGDALANILALCGFQVQREYYVNDSGRQIRTLGRSVWLRYRQLAGEKVAFPPECYQGDYIRRLAEKIPAAKGQELLAGRSAAAVEYCARAAAREILDGIRADLHAFGVTFDRWASEQSLYDDGKVQDALQALRDRGQIYEQDGAQWFKSSRYGDEKDRVVVRRSGETTYFASDIAYHQGKFERGFEWVIDVWGADHHGYIPRVSAAVEATGYRREQFGVVLVQLVNLLRGGEPVAMSTRAGEFVTLREVIGEVGMDAARFIFLTRHHESALDFDLELARQKTNENPVYYVQYVHARIASILRKGRQRGVALADGDAPSLERLTEPGEIALIKTLARYPEAVRASAEQLEPHRIPYYLMNLASAFHTYYNKHRVLADDPELSADRLYLVLAVQKVIRNGLSLLGVTAPERM